jgi:hypothetical protein
MKEVYIPHLGHTVKLGRRRPARPPLHRMAKYIDLSMLPPAPDATDYSAKAMAAIAQMYLNNKLGCCTVSGAYHILGVTSGNATGTPFLATDAEIEGDYSAITKYVPGDPSTDQGADENDVIAYYRTTGFANGVKILGSVGGDATNLELTKQSICLFENQYLGMELPAPWIGADMPTGNGSVWDVAGDPDPDNGHCVVIVGYNAQGVLIVTWGMLVLLTWAAYTKYCVPSAGGDSYIWLLPDQVAQGQNTTPNGVAWNTLIEDFAKFGGVTS